MYRYQLKKVFTINQRICANYDTKLHMLSQTGIIAICHNNLYVATYVFNTT